VAPISLDPAQSERASLRPRRVALAYSGGLASSCLIPWLKQQYGCQVIAVVADVGQPGGVAGLQARALASGAAACHVLDLRGDFLTDHLFPALQAGVTHDHPVLTSPAMAYPLIARHQIEIALSEECDALAHGAGPDAGQAGFDLTYQALAPMLRVLAPGQMWRTGFEAADHTEWRSSASSEGIVPRPGGRSGADGRDRLAVTERSVTIEFAQGIPVAINGRSLASVELMAELNRLGGQLASDQSAGSWPAIPDRDGDAMPGAWLLATAHRDLEQRVLDPATLNLKNLLAHIYADVVYNGSWFSPLREALDAFVAKTQEPVSGEIRVHVTKHHWNAANQRLSSAHSGSDLAARGADAVYHQAAAMRFMDLNGIGRNAAAERGRRLRERDMVILK
jgi:argininosuccinate synthase